MLIDTHAHLFKKEYDNVDDVILEALAEDVKLIIVSGCDQETNKEALLLAKKYKQVFATVGYAPTNIIGLTATHLEELESLMQEEKVVGIGEIGLDYYWNQDQKEIQKDWFIKQIRLAKKYQKPIVVHCREAFDDLYKILKDEKVEKGIIHCYTGSLELAKKINKLGIFLGIGGIVTFKNNKLIDVIKNISLEYIVLETDAPYLAPEPVRGSLNKPSYLKFIAQKTALVKGLRYKEVVIKTGENALSLFDLKHRI